MSNEDTPASSAPETPASGAPDTPTPAPGELPVVPAATGDASRADPPLTKGGAPEALGFNLRFEAGRALLSLERCALVPGLTIDNALFEVPDVAFPLDASGGAHRFQDKRLTLRAVELTLDVSELFLPDELARGGLRLLRQRSRAGGVEVLFATDGPSGEVPIRARGLFVAAGDAGLAAVLHEIIPFGRAPRTRLDLATTLLDALQLPGGRPARGMVRRAEVFRSVFGRLLPSFGWKVPAMGAVRIHEANLVKSGLALRAWAGERPDGWKKPRKQRRGPLEDAVALAMFADDLAEAGDEAARLKSVDRVVDAGAPPPALVPFLAEILRVDARRRHEGDDLVKEAAIAHEEHLGVLSALVDEDGIDDDERRLRLLKLGEAAEEVDEVWVSSRAFLSAAQRALTSGDRRAARQAAELAYDADPALAEAGMLCTELLAAAGEGKRALTVGRQTLERIDDDEAREQFLVGIAPIAAREEGPEAARKLLRAALRTTDRVDALAGLLEIEIQAGHHDRAAELLTRLLAKSDATRAPAERARVLVLAADLAEARGAPEEARAHLVQARELAPDNGEVAVRLARVLASSGALDRAVETLTPLVENDPIDVTVATELASYIIARGGEGDARRARDVLSRLDDVDRNHPRVVRLDAEAGAFLGNVEPLAALVRNDADAAEPGAPRVALLLDAAKLLRRAGATEHVAVALADALAEGDAGLDAICALIAGELDDMQAVAATAWAWAERGGDAGALRSLAGRVRDEHPRRAYHLLLPCTDTADRLTRMALMHEVGDVAGELDEARAALNLLDEDDTVHRPTLAARVGDLHLAEGGAGPEAAVVAYAEAYRCGADVADRWLAAALQTSGPDALAPVLMAHEVDTDGIAVERLREVLDDEALVGGEERRARRLQLRRALAFRSLDEQDARALVDDLSRQAPIAETGAVWLELGERAERADWIAEGARLLAGSGEGAAGLERLLVSVQQDPEVGEATVRYAFELACEHGTADDVWTASERLLPLLTDDEQREVHARRAAALEGRDADRWEAALVAWLDAEPAAMPAVAALVPRLLARGDLNASVQRLRAAVDGSPDAGLTPGTRHLVREAVATAQARGDVEAEVAALELFLVGGELEPDDAAALERLADHTQRMGRYADAVAALLRRLDIAGEPPALADAAWRAARLLIDEVEAPHRAAEVLARRTAWAPEDHEASSELVRLLDTLGDVEGHRAELVRRLTFLEPGPERVATLVSLGDLQRHKLDDRRGACQTWLRALRGRPFSEAAHRRLLDEARSENDHHLATRIHLAAARSQEEDRAAADAASEAGALLAGILLRPRFAAVAYELAAERSPEPGPALRALIEIWRALDDKARTLQVADRYVAAVDGDQRAVALEVKADVTERLVGDAAAAMALRREALLLDPTLRASALSLERALREAGEPREAITVRRALAEASEAPALQAQTLAALSASAEADADDRELAAELAHAALELDPKLRSLRVRLVELDEQLERHLDAAEQLGILVDDPGLDTAERVSFARRKARIERESLMDAGAARRTLTDALRHAPDADALAGDLADVLEELDDPAGAASVLTGVLEVHEDGTEALGPREKVLERIAELLEDAGQHKAAMNALDEAAGLAPLSRAGELRRARLAEEGGAFRDAVLSLRTLADAPGVQAEEHLALLGRLAVAAEKAELMPEALAAWQQRLERLPTDRDALCAIERIGVDVGDPQAARSASLVLLGDEEEPEEAQLRRLLWLARDARDRLDDPSSAVGFLEQARAIHDEAGVRRELFLCAERAAAAAAALEALDAMVAAGDALDAADRLRRAELRTEGSGDVADALEDALAAAAAGEPADRVGKVVDVLASREPGLVGERLLRCLDEESDEAVVNTLRARLPVARIDDPDLLAALADRLPDDVEVARAAAAASERTGDVLGAADRLIALGAQDGQTGALDQAAQLLADADVDVGAWLSRIEVLQDAIAVDAARRDVVLHQLRDAEAWAAVVDLLEASAVVEEGAARRRLRMEAVAILRAGLDDPGRAADILEEVLADDPENREAWGELLEALEALGDLPRLEAALARRTEGVQGLERRELVRRRAVLLLELNRGPEALAPLAEVRAEAPDDADLKALHREVIAQQGEAELLAFHVDELRKHGAPDDARVILTTHAADSATRAEATLALLTGRHASAEALAHGALSRAGAIDERGSEVARVAAGLDDAQRLPWLEAVARAAVDQLPPREGLAVMRAAAAAVPGSLSQRLVLTAVELARRTEGPRAALRAARELGSPLPEQVDARLWLHLAPRGGDAQAFFHAAEVAGFDEAQQRALETTRRSVDGAGLREQLELAGTSWLFEAASGLDGVVALVRHGDTTRARARMAAMSTEEMTALAQRAYCLPLTAARLALRADLEQYLPDDLRRDELARLEDLALTVDDPVAAAACVDAAMALLGITPERARRRADLAITLGTPDAVEHLERAAALAEDVEDALRWRRQRVERMVRGGARGEALAEALRGWVQTAPDDESVLRDAMAVAEATRQEQIVDDLLGELAARAQEPATALEALQRRVRHRVERLKQPAAAISILLQSSGKFPDAGLRQQALDLALAEGLVEHQITLLDDALARAGLLAALGRFNDAWAASAAVDGLPRALLQLEIAHAIGDVAAQREALQQAVGFAEVDVSLFRRQVDLCGTADEVVGAALAGLARFPADAQLASTLVAALDAASDDAVRTAVEQIRRAVEGQQEGAASAVLVEAWVSASARLGDEADATAALLELARRNNDDGAWIAYLSRVARQQPADALLEAMAPLLEREAVVDGVAATAPDALAAALRLRLAGEEAASLLVLLAALERRTALPTSLELLAVDACEQAGDLAQAGERLARITPSTAVERAGQRLRLARWALRRDAVDDAAAELLAIPLAGLTGEARALALEVIAQAGGRALPLAVRLAAASAQEADVDRALSMAAEHDDDAVAAAVAAWRLKTVPDDARAWHLAASRGGAHAARFFHGQLSLRGEAVDRGALDEVYLRARDLREGAVDLEPRGSGSPTTPLAQARQGARGTRRRAWKELADERARAGEHLTAARLLMRAGLSLTDAPIEVRLAVDPQLASPQARVRALAEGMPLVTEPQRQSQLTAMFSALDEQGFAGARHRAAVFVEDDGFSSVSLIDAADLEAPVALGARLRSAGRALSLRERSTLGALAHRLDQQALGDALHPGLRARPAPSASERMSEALLERAERAREAGHALEALGLLRLRIAQRGTTAAAEVEIQALAEGAERWDLVAESLGREAALYGDPSARAGRLAARARVHQERLGRADLALQDARYAASLRPSDRLLVELWTELARTVDDAGELATALSQLERLAVDDEERIALVLERSALLRSQLSAPGGALAALDSALATVGANSTLLVERGRCLMQLDRNFEAGEALLSAADAQSASEQRHALRREAAALFIDSAEPERALQALLLSAREGDGEALDQAEEQARAHQLFGPLASVLELQRERSDDESKRRSLTLEQAQLLAEDVGDRAAAVALLEAQAVEDAGDIGARLRLAEWYLLDRRLLDAALAYESAATIEGLPDVAVGPPAREAACLLSALGDLERAGPLAEMAIEHGVVDLKVLAVAFAFHRSHEDFRRVDEVLGREIELIEDPRDAALLWMDRATLRRDQLGDAAGARQALHRVLELRPDHEEALAAMREDAVARDSFGALRAALSRAVDQVDDVARRVGWLLEIAALDDGQFHDLKAAEATIDRALAYQPSDADLLVRKAVLKVKRGDVEGLPDLLERAEAAGAETLPGMLQLVRGDALLLSGDRDAARGAFEAATQDPEVADRAWDRLLDLAEGLGDEASLLRQLGAARRVAQDGERRARLARREARLGLKLGDEDAAVDANEALLVEEPGDTEALHALRNILARRRRLERLDPLYEAWARSPEDPVEAAARLSEFGAFVLDDLGAEARAKEVFQAALELNPDEQGALVRLGAIAYAAREFEPALELLDRVRTEMWPRGTEALALERAECAVQLKREDAAERVRAILREDPKHVGALELLLRRAQDEDDQETIEFALVQLAGAVDVNRDPVRAAKIFSDLARVHLAHERVEPALQAAEQALELRPSAVETLQLIAEVREQAGQLVEAADAWRRVESIGPADRRLHCRQERARLLEAAGERPAAADAWREVYALTGDHADRARADALVAPEPASPDPDAVPMLSQAEQAALGIPSPVPDVVELGDTGPMVAAPGEEPEPTSPDFDAAGMQAQGLVDEGRFADAVALLSQTFDEGRGDADLAAVGVSAARGAEDARSLVYFVEQRLKGATDKDEVLRISLEAGRAARESLQDYDKAADLLYVAHQAAPDDLDIRLELTDLYARIPRLVRHAQTGVLQLLRRAPVDARIYRLGGHIAEQLGQTARQRNLEAVAAMLDGAASPAELLDTAPVTGWAPEMAGMDEATVSSRIVPEGLGKPIQTLVRGLSSALEEIFLSNNALLGNARRIEEVSGAGEAISRALMSLVPGRPVKPLCGPGDEVRFVAGTALHIVFPESMFEAPDRIKAARMGRAIALGRLGGVMAEALSPAQLGTMMMCLQVLFNGREADSFVASMAERLRGLLDEQTQAATAPFAQQAFGGDGPDLKAWVDAVARAGDRFGLLASGSVVAALVAGPLPQLLSADGPTAAAFIRADRRALDLCAYAARDNVWAVREQRALPGR